ncbi:hypothetical protein WG66_014850 [Moniliophthora roreri]|nr:hypothetical protein WG66_014850 [Moniliophthora roreri]
MREGLVSNGGTSTEPSYHTYANFSYPIKPTPIVDVEWISSETEESTPEFLRTTLSYGDITVGMRRAAFLAIGWHILPPKNKAFFCEYTLWTSDIRLTLAVQAGNMGACIWAPA